MELKQALQGLCPDETDSTYELYLELAKAEVLRRLYPFSQKGRSVPEEHQMTQVRIAEFLLNKRGAIGETSHGELQMQRSYESGDIPSSLTRNLIPEAFCPGEEGLHETPTN